MKKNMTYFFLDIENINKSDKQILNYVFFLYIYVKN